MHAHTSAIAFAAFAVLLQQPALAQAEAQKPDVPPGWSYDSLYADGLRATMLMDMPVTGPDGEKIGEVANLIVDLDGGILSLIAVVGGRWNVNWDIGETFVNVPWEEVTLETGALSVPVDAQTFEAYPLFPNAAITARQAANDVAQIGEETNPIRAFKATELIGDYARLDDNRYLGYVDDLVFSSEGKLRAVLVVPSSSSPIGERRAFPYFGGQTGFDPGSTYYDVGYTEDEAVLFGPFDLQQLESDTQIDP